MKTESLNKNLRRRIIEKGTEMGCGHFGSAFSCIDAVKYLYDYILKEKEDIFIMSKGHGEMALFAVLESIGKKPEWTFHLNLNEKDGIYATTGSLGHGLPIALGRAIAKTIKYEKGVIFVLLGDGEMEEGSNWEALTIAHHLNIKNLTLLVDWNKYQATDAVDSIASLDCQVLTKRLQAFGCNTLTINGHDHEELAFIKSLPNGLNAVILDTIKGKGVAYLEKNHLHGFDFNKHQEVYQSALENLK